MANRRTNPFARILGQGDPMAGRRGRLKNVARRAVLTCESLEGRVVLSQFGGGFPGGFGGNFGGQGGFLIETLTIVGIGGVSSGTYGFELGGPWLSTGTNPALAQYKSRQQFHLSIV